jgi:hypothetical protein
MALGSVQAILVAWSKKHGDGPGSRLDVGSSTEIDWIKNPSHGPNVDIIWWFEPL